MEASKKTVVITGGNTGLGYECAKAIAKSSPRNSIVLACRNPQKGGQAAEALRAESGNPDILFLELDLASLKSVRAFPKRLKAAQLPPLDALVCNAGVQVIQGTQYTRDGFEMTFGVNHLGHFLLANLLLAYMDSGRIVFVSSDTHDPQQQTGMPAPVYEKAERLAYPDKSSTPLNGTQRYTTSKLCNIYCAYELAERIPKQTGKQITVNAFNPGLIPGTGLARDHSVFARFAWKYILPAIAVFIPNANTAANSGKALARLVTDPKLLAVTGKYFSGMEEIPSSEQSYNKKKRTDLWETSVRLTGLQPAESALRENME